MSSRRVEFNGRFYPSIAALSRDVQIPQSTLRKRLDEGRALVIERDDNLRVLRAMGRPVGHPPGSSRPIDGRQRTLRNVGEAD